MKKIILLTIVFFGALCGHAQYTIEDQIYDYIDQYKDLAMQEMELYNVPASITLAQAIYTSKVGTNRVAQEANNHFGIKCHTDEWTGETFYETKNQSKEFCFRKYATVQDSYRDHSLFLSQRSRYVKLFYFPITDYKSWARGLQEAGYSGNPRYADTLISLIEKYFLMHYDRKVAKKLGDTSALQAMSVPTPERVTDTPKPSAPKSPVPKETPKAEPVTYSTTPVSQPNTVPSAQTPPPAQPQPQVQTPPAPEKPAATYEPRNTPPTPPQAKEEPKQDNSTANTNTSNKPQEENSAIVDIPSVLPKKIDGKNVFVLDPYNVPFKGAYYPYTTRQTYENNKTKFIIAKEGDTYKKLANVLQLTEKNLRLYNDVYDDSEPVVGEVVYVEMKSTKSPVEYHTLQEGDTYRYVAQKYGVQLKIIIKRNSGAISNYGIGDRICIGCK